MVLIRFQVFFYCADKNHSLEVLFSIVSQKRCENKTFRAWEHNEIYYVYNRAYGI